jgi:hypothetical protein
MRRDVTIAEHCKQLFAALTKDFGKLDIVFAKCRHLRQNAYRLDRLSRF